MRHIKKLATRIGNKGTQVTTTEILKKGTPKITIQKTVVVSERIESPTPLINILTRTSNRPNGFKRCRESIENQTYKNIRHIVSIDNLNDEEYVKKYNVDYFFMDKEAISKENDIPDPKTGTRFIYNLYLNHLINEVKEGWVFILDDDDYFADRNCVQKMVNAVKNPTDLILWQMKYPNGQVLPSLQELGMPPRLARISSQCFMLHSGIAKTIRWDGWKCGDFRFVQKAYAKTGEKRVIKEVLVNLGGVGLGMKKDINTVQSNLMGNNVYNNNEHGSAIDIFKNKFSKKINNNTLDTIQDKSSSYISNQMIKLEIISVGWNCEKYIENNYKSLKNQINGNYKYTIHYLDDGSTDNSFKILEKIAQNDNNVILYQNKKNMGAAYSRNKIISNIKNNNAIGLMIDLDDAITNTTFKDISNHYLLNSNTLITFGDYKSISNNKITKIDTFDDNSINNVKFSGKKFLCPPLRTFKIELAKKIPEHVFKNEKNEWYKYCTDVCLCTGILAQCYANEVYKLNYTHYIYNDKRNDGTLSRFKAEKARAAQLIFKNIDESFKKTEIRKYNNVMMKENTPIAIIMCTWKRISKLEQTLNLLSNQTNKNFKLYIWNNNIEEADIIENIIQKFKDLNILVFNSKKNIGGIGRFYYAKKINKQHDKILFIDDDQIFSNKFVEQMDSFYEKKSIVSWWGWKIKDSYFNRERKINLEEVDYCGTGGMILPSKIFDNEVIFNIPEKYKFIEDLWLSIVAKYELGYNLKGCRADIEIITDGNDQYVKLKNLKEEFYKFLKNKYKF